MVISLFCVDSGRLIPWLRKMRLSGKLPDSPRSLITSGHFFGESGDSFYDALAEPLLKVDWQIHCKSFCALAALKT
jgi:hypothetical protein